MYRFLQNSFPIKLIYPQSLYALYPESPFNIQRLLLCPSTTNERSYVESLVTN